MSMDALRFETFKGIDLLFPLGLDTPNQRVLFDLIARQFEAVPA